MNIAKHERIIEEYQELIEKSEYKISREYIRQIENLARKILQSHPRLDEFIMGMGGACFTAKLINFYHGDSAACGNTICIDTGRYKYMSELNDILEENDYRYHMTGYPMRFTAYGKKETNW